MRVLGGCQNKARKKHNYNRQERNTGNSDPEKSRKASNTDGQLEHERGVLERKVGEKKAAGNKKSKRGRTSGWSCRGWRSSVIRKISTTQGKNEYCVLIRRTTVGHRQHVDHLVQSWPLEKIKVADEKLRGRKGVPGQRINYYQGGQDKEYRLKSPKRSSMRIIEEELKTERGAKGTVITIFGGGKRG